MIMKAKDNKVLMHALILVTILATGKSAEAEITMEAAFQGHCGHTSPCEQLCYEIHDGMYECDCIEGYELNKNGYSCQVINSTANYDGQSKSDEDVLYQKGASFSAKLANGSDRDNQIFMGYSSSLSSLSSSAKLGGAPHIAKTLDSISSALSSMEDVDGEEGDTFFANDQKSIHEQRKVNSNDYYISSEDVYFTNGEDQELTNTSQDVPEIKENSLEHTTELDSIGYRHIVITATTNDPSEVSLNKKSLKIRLKSLSMPTIKTTDTDGKLSKSSVKNFNYVSKFLQSNNPNNKISNYQQNGIILNTDSDLTTSQNTYQDRNAILADDLTNLKQIENKVKKSNNNIKQSLAKLNISKGGKNIITDGYICDLNCGTEGERIDGLNRCQCPFGKSGKGCIEDIQIRTPKFSNHSWIAFPALRGAYKHIQIRIDFRPESFNGIILLSGERDDLTGDFMSLLLNKGFVEFWFDCGSGVGSVRSRETVLLNEWNSVIIYRHRWDAWIVLNHGTKVQGRSNGLFSRITFREPVFLGGTGNITGLAKRLPLNNGFVGCIRRFVANEHEYKFEEHPLGDVTKGFDIQDCVTDKCFKYPCQHGGKCLPSDQGAACLCPIGFVGDLCEIRMDLQVPAFNGSSYLRYSPLGESALIWLELKIILKAEHPDGLILYSGADKRGDFIALYLSEGFVEFIFDLGSGPALVRSEYPLTIGQWHSVKISRTARLAVLKIDKFPEVMTISSNGFWHLSLPENFFLGGVDHVDKLPLDLKSKAFFVGCIQKIDVNGHLLSIVSEALGGTNIGNCPHACVARPCGPLAECIPQMENYECRCNALINNCSRPVVTQTKRSQMNKSKKKRDKLKVKSDKHHTLSKSNKSNGPSKFDINQINSKFFKYPTMSTIINNPLTKEYKTPTKHAHFAYVYNKRKSWQPLVLNKDVYDKEDDIIYRDANYFDDERKANQQPLQSKLSSELNDYNHKLRAKTDGQIRKTSDFQVNHRENIKKENIYGKSDQYHKDISTFDMKLSKLPTHYESFQTNPEIDILTFDDNVEVDIGIDQNSDKEIVRNEDYKPDESDRNRSSVKYSRVGSHTSNSDFEYKEHGNDRRYAHDAMNEETKFEPFFVDKTLFDSKNSAEDYHRKELEQDMRRILANGQKNVSSKKQLKLVVDEYDYEKIDNDPKDGNKFIMNGQKIEKINSSSLEGLSTNYAENNDDLLEPVQTDTEKKIEKMNVNKAASTIDTQTDWSLLKTLQLPANHQSQFLGVKKNFGACFAGEDSYFYYNDAETMSQIINYNIDLNLRIKTHSQNGVILWTGRKVSTEGDADFLSLGIENGYLHFRYDLGSGEVNIKYNTSRVSDGLWHRVRAIRDAQAGHLEMDGRKTTTQYSPGKLKQLNTDTGLYVGGMPNAVYFTRRKYKSNFIGCISEIVLAGELKLNFDANALGSAHNVETGLL